MITSQSHHTQNGGELSVEGGFVQIQVPFSQLHATHFGQYFLQSGSLLQCTSGNSKDSASEFMIRSACKYVSSMLYVTNKKLDFREK